MVLAIIIIDRRHVIAAWFARLFARPEPVIVWDESTGEVVG